jgi:adenine-specific DNA-methyltransferase
MEPLELPALQDLSVSGSVGPLFGHRPALDCLGAGMCLHWEGRRGFRTRIPAPRALEPVPSVSFGDADGNRIIEGDNLQVMLSLRSQYQGSFDVAYLDPPYNTRKKDFPSGHSRASAHENEGQSAPADANP